MTTVPKVAKLTQVAGAVSVAALAAWLVKKLDPGGIKNERRPYRSQAKVHWVNHGGPAGRGSQKARPSKQEARGKTNAGQNAMAQGNMNLCQIKG